MIKDWAMDSSTYMSKDLLSNNTGGLKNFPAESTPIFLSNWDFQESR